MTQAEINEKKLYDKLSKFIALYGKKLDKLYSSIDKDISRLFAKYAKDNKMSYLEALKYLTDNEREEFQEDLNFYLEKIRDEEYLKENRAYLEALSIRARVKRLEFMKADIREKVDLFFQELKEESKKELGELGSEAFRQKVEEIVNDIPKDLQNKITITSNKTPVEKVIEETTGIEIKTPQIVGTAESGGAIITQNGEKINLATDELANWGKINSDLMEELVEFPWSGENYSDKIWGECDNLVDVLNNELTQGLVTGKPYNQIIEEMSKKLDVEKWKIERLVRTEGAFVTNQAQLSAYYKSGIKQYRYLARLDERTSEACRELNGKVFDVDKAQAGENYPPMHPYCRSVTEAVFDKK